MSGNDFEMQFLNLPRERANAAVVHFLKGTTDTLPARNVLPYEY